MLWSSLLWSSLLWTRMFSLVSLWLLRWSSTSWLWREANKEADWVPMWAELWDTGLLVELLYMAPPWLEGKSADSMAEVELGVELLDMAPPWSAGASADKLVVRLGMDPQLRAPALSTHDSCAHSTIAAS
mmetsp:Transcript_70795/g.202857  ORF Transcript_70795/g.202857 Transcript_70795/m.202857 type:complete len:130 (+) Transcript_70795:248-637(+)